jgi:hypothetical protein
MPKGICLMRLKDQKVHKRQLSRQVYRVFIVGMITLMSISVPVWILNSEGIIQGTWPTIFSVIFTVFSTILGLLQWHAQISTQPDVPSPVPQYDTAKNKLSRGGKYGLNDHKGALIVYTNRRLHRTLITLTSGFHIDNSRPHITANVIHSNGKSQKAFIAVFTSLEPGNYTVHINAGQRVAKVIVRAGYVVEIDW